jgi:sugar phosphate isomerase/epimerase
MKPGLSLLYLTGSTPKQMFSAMEKLARECSVWELVDDGNLKLDRKIMERLKEYAASYGFEYSVHAPFTDLNIASLNPHVRKLSLKAVEEAIRKAYKINAETVVIHPGFKGPLEYFYPKKSLKVNLESARILLEQAENLGVHLAIENMPKGEWPLLSTVEEFEAFFSEEPLEGLGLALDIGHAQTVGQVEVFIRKFKGRISHVHLHDNLGDEDSHLKVGNGIIDWASTIKALKRVSFSGYLIVESVQEPYESLKTLKSMI